MIWFRIDNRLVHGQVIEAWLPYSGATCLAVANDELAEDTLRQQIMLLAVPSRVHTEFLTLEEIPLFVVDAEQKKQNVLVLFANCPDARKAFDYGLKMDRCNIGNLHYTPGKKQLCQHIALSVEEEECLRYLENSSVALDFRCIPADNAQLKDW